jgi:DNA polymerase-3 subunit epsilon
MNDYFLVIDTETSGFPKKWDVPYDAKNNWPHVLQIAWLIFDVDGKLIKKENHYLKPAAFKITKASFKVHQLSLNFLKHRGKERSLVFKKLIADLEKYKPLMVAHFVELDYHMIGAEMYRLNLDYPLQNVPLFCTLKASAPYVRNPNFEYLKLNRFYKTLFNKSPEKLHDALADALLTAEIFFHLLNNKEIDDHVIQNQKNIKIKEKNKVKLVSKIQLPLILVLVLILVLIIILIWLLNGK